MPEERTEQVTEQEHPHALENVGRCPQFGRNKPIDKSIYSPGDWLLKLGHFDHRLPFRKATRYQRVIKPACTSSTTTPITERFWSRFTAIDARLSRGGGHR